MSYIHPTAIVETSDIGENCKVWAFSHICKGSKIGNGCTIGEGVYIGPNVKIGNNCKIQNHSLIYEGVLIEDDVFIGPNVVTTNDIKPKAVGADWRETRFKETIIKKGASIGANSTIICGNIIGKNSLIGAGSVVTKNISDETIAYGNPALVKKIIQ